MLNECFSDDDEKPDDRNAIDYFFERNHKAAMFAEFPKSKFHPTYVYLSEEDLVHLFSTDPVTKPIMFAALSQDTDKQASSNVVKKKGVLIKSLLYPVEAPTRINEYHRKLTLQANSEASKFKLKDTVCTNGLVLKLLAYDTTTDRKRRVQQSSDQSDKNAHEDLFEDTDEGFVLDDAFLDQLEAESIQDEIS